MQPQTTLRAAGVVLVRQGESDEEVAVIHRPHRNDWSLPKGKNDPDEHDAIAAVRETREETGYSVVLEAGLPRQQYYVDAQLKSVAYWRARAVDGQFVPNPEADELRWVTLADASELLTYPEDAEIVAEAIRLGPTTPLVLLRHGKAMARGDWAESDDERPLSEVGEDQARLLARLLPLFGVAVTITSPSKRCRDTLGPLSTQLGRPLDTDPRWSEQALNQDPRACRQALTQALKSPDALVVCTHRPNLSFLAERLDRAIVGGSDLADAKLPPGHAWILNRRTRRPRQIQSVTQLAP